MSWEGSSYLQMHHEACTPSGVPGIVRCLLNKDTFRQLPPGPRALILLQCLTDLRAMSFPGLLPKIQAPEHVMKMTPGGVSPLLPDILALFSYFLFSLGTFRLPLSSAEASAFCLICPDPSQLEKNKGPSVSKILVYAVKGYWFNCWFSSFWSSLK